MDPLRALPEDTPRTEKLPKAPKQPKPKIPGYRRSPMLIVIGVLMIVGGMLGAYAVYVQISDTQPVIAVVSAVPRGQQITQADLAIVEVGFDPMLKPLPASELGNVVGKYAKADLVVGTFLTPDSVGNQPEPNSGEAMVGVVLATGRYPDVGLAPGNKVELVPVPDPSNPVVPTAGIPATITSIASNGSSGNSLLFNLTVSQLDAYQVSTLAANNRLTLILISRG